jgi:hypothetical protein
VEEGTYTQQIQRMTWSYSRVKAFYDCPYRWFLKYLHRPKLAEKRMFFSDYGSFVHKLIAQFYTQGKTPQQLCDDYLCEFRTQVAGHAQSMKVFQNYFNSGFQYLKNFQPFQLEPVTVEKEARFHVDGIPFTGYIDFLGKKDGEFYIIDHKSRMLKPRSTRAKPTVSDRELDAYLRQLYLYSIAVEEEFGQKPKALCFNCFRSQTMIVEPFREEAYEEAKTWITSKIHEIEQEGSFKPDVEYFKCKHLCEMQDHCEYYQLSYSKR